MKKLLSESVLLTGSRIVIVVALRMMAPMTSGFAEEMFVAGERSSTRVGEAATRDLFSTTATVPGARFVHTATTDNIVDNFTLIDHPLTNNNPDAIILVTQNWNPGGVGNTYNDHPIGVWYSYGAQRWSIFNQDNTSSMPEGAAFNVLIPSAEAEAFVHSAMASNITLNYTLIDHPLTNNNPNAIVFVTQNWNPGGTGGTYNDHSIGAWYSHIAHKWGIFNQDKTSSMPDGADFNVLIATTTATAFVHSAEPDNIAGHYTYLDHPLTNHNPNAIVLVTQNWNPDGVGGTYNDHATGVWYSSGAKRWAVFNQDSGTMPDGAAFNVLVATTNSAAFVHSAAPVNITFNSTYFDHSLTNDNPNAIVLVTQNWNPGGVGGTYNDHPIGVWYSHGAKRWAVFNQDITSSMPDGAAFNILLPAVDTSVFVHTANTDNIASNWTYIDHPLTNNNPDAIVMVTQNWNPSGVGGTYNDYPIGVWYSFGAQRWSIFNQDQTSSMPEGAAFNVLIPSAEAEAFVHTATTHNIVGNWTYIDHPLTDNSPKAIVFVTQNWNPSGTVGTYNNHPIGVWYDGYSDRWSIFNQDLAAMPDGADFNILVIPPIFADGFESGDTFAWSSTVQ